MKYLLISLSLFVTSSIFSQTLLSKTDFDLGEISLLNEDVVDLQLKNISEDAIFILRIETDRTTKIQYTSKNISTSSTQTLRIKLNPTRKGKVERKVNIYLSSNSEPVEIKITADVKALPRNNKQACPDFRSVPTQSSTTVNNIVGINKSFKVVMYTENFSEEHVAEIRAVSDEISTLQTPKTPQPPLWSERPKREKKIRKTPNERRNSPSIGAILFGKNEKLESKEDAASEKLESPIEVVVADENKRVDFEEQEIRIDTATSEVSETKEIVEKINSNLLTDSYKPNNIIFLIDASTSMREEEKMDILKKAMINLVGPLREIDLLSIVTYSGDATVILKPTPGNKKQEIINLINNIKADGSTQAVKGIKKAIQIGKNSFIENGNNQIFLASDGAFDIGARNESLRRKISATAKDGLTIDVLGIKNAKWTNKSLEEIAELGQGSLLKVKSFKDADKVLNEVKKKSNRN